MKSPNAAKAILRFRQKTARRNRTLFKRSSSPLNNSNILGTVWLEEFIDNFLKN